MLQKMKNYIEEILIIIGLTLIIVATAMLSLIASIYVTGLVLLFIGLFLATTKKERR